MRLTSSFDQPLPEDMATDDSGTDASMECDNVCGDVNGDGMVNITDIQELGLIVNGDRAATPCELVAGDLLADGGIDQDDLELLGLMVAGTIDGACEACVGQCGDLDGNGEISILDVPEVLELTEGEAPTACQFVQADVLKDWKITEADAEAVGNMAFEVTDGACMPCDLQCGCQRRRPDRACGCQQAFRPCRGRAATRFGLPPLGFECERGTRARVRHRMEV